MKDQSDEAHFDVVVVGGTPSGIAAAISAARLGCSVALTEYHNHLGAMAASGLGKTDILNKDAIGGVFLEFVQRVHQHYIEHYGTDSENVERSKEGYYYEPSVAEKIFGDMTQESGVHVYLNHRLSEVVSSETGVVAVRIVDRVTKESCELHGDRFVDATYEGDLAAWSGAPYRVGRESRSDYNELHAGIVYQDHRTHTFLQGTTGTGDTRLQAYTYRLCFTDDPANSRILENPPPDYDRTRYLQYFDDLQRGRLDPPDVLDPELGEYGPIMGTLVRAFSMAELPNRKLDVNMNPRPMGFPFCQENEGYIEADWKEREAIAKRIRNIALGLLYFVQNDEQVPEEHRKLANRFHMARDEFIDNDNFPWQLYVREARRVWGEYTLSEKDVIPTDGTARPPVHRDSVVAGEFPIDSFPVQKREQGREGLEGYLCVLSDITRPYQIPYRIIVPLKIERLLVPVAASATHVAFSTVRMEPTWMALGQAAGIAAYISLRLKCRLRDVPVDLLQRLLLRSGQILTYFDDLSPEDQSHTSLQYLGVHGCFSGYQAKADEALSRQTATRWLSTILDSLDPSRTGSSFIEGVQYQAKPFLGFLLDLLKALQLETPNNDLSSTCLQKMEEYGLPRTTLTSPTRDFALEPLTRGEFSFALYQLLGILIPLANYLDE